jgi:hypothetical protein
VADLLGQLAVGRFEPWCEVDFPPAGTTSRLRLEDPAFLVNQVRSELCAAQPSGSSAAVPPRLDFESAEQCQKAVRYYKLSLDCRDLLAAMLQTMNVVIERATRNEACQAFAGVVNCLDVSPERLEWFLDDAVADSKRVLITNTTWLAHSKSWSPTVQVPCSYHVLACAVEAATARH